VLGYLIGPNVSISSAMLQFWWEHDAAVDAVYMCAGYAIAARLRHAVQTKCETTDPVAWSRAYYGRSVQICTADL